jgi:meso-butanediol dehydrogenase / (S,S)-butanediol dehydrogenase / diacetyl reductase
MSDAAHPLIGRRVLVTGAGSGIGAAISGALAAAGAAVAVNDCDAERARGVCDELAVSGATACSVPGDVSTRDGASGVVDSAVKKLGGLSALVNNVGIVRGEPLATITPETWDSVMRTDLSSALFCSQAAHAELQKVGGPIVNTSSLCALFPAPGAGSYNVAKAGLVSLTQQMALEWGRDGIRVNAIAPGIIAGTNFSPSSNRPEVLERRQGIVPLGRTGTADDVAPVAVFLLSDDSRYITGQVIVVDGGLGVALQTFIPG